MGVVYSYSQNLSFESAEELIVYNKSNNIPKYKGINIEYNYKVFLKDDVPEDSYSKLANHFFSHVLATQVYDIDGQKYFSILTKGSQENNNVSREVPKELNNQLVFNKRKYHLSDDIKSVEDEK